MVDSYCRYDRRFLILQPNKCQTTRVHVRLNLEHTSESRIVVQELFLMPPHANPQETFTISSSDFFVLFKLTTSDISHKTHLSIYYRLITKCCIIYGEDWFILQQVYQFRERKEKREQEKRFQLVLASYDRGYQQICSSCYSLVVLSRKV